jgi:hypothetical protein
MFLMRSPKRRLFAYALIFASFAHLRFIQTLTGRGDELILAQEGFGISSRIFVALIVFLIGLPPVVVAYRVIANKWRTLVFTCSWLLPLPVLIVLLVGNSLLFGANGDEIQGATLAGIPFIVLIVDLLACILLMILTARQLGKET